MSHLIIPPNIFTNIPLTASSDKIILNASLTFSLVALPPTSKKLAGDEPLRFMISIVAIANPAPFTKQPISPSNFMYAKSNFLANVSEGSSSVSSLSSKTSDCLNKLLLSKDIFASSAINLFSFESTSGFISTKLASKSTKVL